MHEATSMIARAWVSVRIEYFAAVGNLKPHLTGTWVSGYAYGVATV